MIPFKKLFALAFLITAALPGAGGVFTSHDKQFTIDLPSGWTEAKIPAENSVLSVAKGTARIDIRALADCDNEACIEKKTQQDLLDVKRKKMQIVGNSYTGEEMKRIDFSTGDPFFYISFFTPKNDFSAGYFLVGPRAYSVLSKDLSYAEADLIFSFISPLAPQAKRTRSEAIRMALNDPRAYDIVAAPAVQEEIILAPGSTPPPAAAKAKKETSKSAVFKIPTLVAKNMPPYIRQIPRVFDAVIFLIFFFILIQTVALVTRVFVKPKQDFSKANPNSLYPIKFRRLYGTPSLIFRARDNQGNTLISLSSRWDSLFLFTGILLVIAALALIALTGVIENTKFLSLSMFTISTIYSACTLVIPLGVVVFFCGLLWSQLILREFALYDAKGKKAVFVLQRGFELKTERYFVYFAKSKDVLILERKRFHLLRQWNLYSKERVLLAQIQETDPLHATVRKFFGHLWGLLRASYTVLGPMDSRGYVHNTCSAFNAFNANIDKPQAIEARDLLVAALIVNIRDKDKWYPWIN